MQHLIVFKEFVYGFLDKPKKETSKLVKNKMKYGEFWSVFLLNAASMMPQRLDGEKLGKLMHPSAHHNKPLIYMHIQ